LKRLPGVEVNADGEIEVEGKSVQMLVNGKKFFEGDTKLGSRNIQLVDKIQVLRNFSEVGQLKGLENSNDDVAINIKLKSGKINFGLVIFQLEQILLIVYYQLSCLLQSKNKY
jgi:hypothetical protein